MCTRSRGVKFEFEPGETILCFEPDATKARVLYYAKVLEQVVGSDGNEGKRKAEYLVHFQGWNASWDRVVPESFVLRNDETNRALMRKLASVARQVKRNKSRKKRIEDILKRHFKRQASGIFGVSDGEEDGDDEGEENGAPQDGDDDDEEGGNDYDDDEEDSEEESKDSSESEQEDNNDTEEEEEEDQEPQVIKLELPQNLKRKLEDDCYSIRCQEKLVSLPAIPNVVTVLEGYVKNFGINVVCATGNWRWQRPTRSNQVIPPEKNIDLAKEMADGLRVFFDFTLPKVLLYPQERLQYDQQMEAHNQIKEEKEEEPEMKDVTNLDKKSCRRNPLKNQASEPSPKIPRLSPKDFSCEEDSEDDSDEEETFEPPRRITRHAFQEEIRKQSTESNVQSKRCPRGRLDSTEEVDGGEVIIRRRHSIRSSPHKSLAERVTPPPPLLIPSNVSSNTSTSSRSASWNQSPKRHSNGGRDGSLENIFDWQLFPEGANKDSGTTACQVYGAHHLLRLFVKLPELLVEMRLPDQNLKHLLQHLEMFIDYLSSRCEELFPDSVFIDAEDAMNKEG